MDKWTFMDNDERLPPPEEKAVHYIHNIEQA